MFRLLQTRLDEESESELQKRGSLPTVFSPKRLNLRDMLEHRYSDKGKLARDCTPVAARWTYDKKTVMMLFIALSLQPDKVVKQIPDLPSDFIESHERWSQYGSEDVRTHLLGMR